MKLPVYGLSFKLTLWYALVVTVTVSVILFVGAYWLRVELIGGVDLLNKAEFREISERLGEAPEQLRDEEIVERIRQHAEIDSAMFFLQIERGRDWVVFRSPNMGNAYFPEVVPENRPCGVELRGHGPVRFASFDHHGLTIVVGSPVSHIEDVFTTYRATGMLLLGGVFFLSLLVGLVLSRMALRPVRVVRETARRISAENMSERICVSNPHDEIGSMAMLLNSMFDRLEGSFAQIRTFTSDASHELRTPLSLIRLYAENLSRGSNLTFEQRALLSSQLAEISRLNRLIDQLLTLTKINGGAIELSRETLEASAYINDLAEDASALAEDQCCRFSLAENEAGTLSLDPQWFRHVVFNLLSNAFKHSPEGGLVTMRSCFSEDEWQFTIQDEGSGVPEEVLPRVFERFVRHAASKLSNTEGSGLGLAISKSIVALHGGYITATNRSDRSGFIVIVVLPFLQTTNSEPFRRKLDG